MSTLQKNQHYVWRHYLLAWATDEKVWCVRAPSTKAFNANVKNVGSETFFYRMPELTRPDVIYLEHLIGRATDPRLQDLNRGWLHDFQLTYRLRRNLELDALDPAVRAELERALDEIEKTISERHHGALEDRAVPILDQLRQGNASFYATVEPAQTFINYLAHQYFRTAKLRNAVKTLSPPAELAVDLNRTWAIETYIYATNVAWSFVAQREKHRIMLLENPTTVPFIAGDQPVINLNDKHATELCFYYPLSPSLALIYHAEPERFPQDRMVLSRFEVEAYNARIFSRSDTQVYSNDPAYLEALVTLPKGELGL